MKLRWKKFLIRAAAVIAAVSTALLATLHPAGPGRADTGDMAALKGAAAQFRGAVLSGDYSRAYELTSAAYRQTHTIGDLRWNFQKMTGQPGLIALKTREADSFYELSPPGAAPGRLGAAYLVIEKVISEEGDVYEELEAFAVTVVKEGGQALVDEIRFGRQD